jgi:tetratricopeptide (TPR) repeat protein
VNKILEKYPEHADTLALKALLVKAIKDPSDDAYKYIKQALKASDNRSFMAWNVYGTLKKEDNDFVTAGKCFANAFKLEPQNYSVAADLACVQAQTRDFKGLVATRNLLVQQRPQIWYYWIGAIVANHLAKNYAVSATLIDTYLKQYDLGVCIYFDFHTK